MSTYKVLTLTPLLIALIACGNSESTTINSESNLAAQQVIDSDENLSLEIKVAAPNIENSQGDGNSQLDSDSNWSLLSNPETKVAAPNIENNQGDDNSKKNRDS